MENNKKKKNQLPAVSDDYHGTEDAELGSDTGSLPIRPFVPF